MTRPKVKPGAGATNAQRPAAPAPLRSWLRLDLRTKTELCLIAVMALLAEVAVKLVPLPRLTRLLGISLIDHRTPTSAATPPSSSSRLDGAAVERRARIVDRLYRAWPRKSSCLRRALVLGYRIRGADPVLLIGVANEDGSIRAHAWIEVDGRVVGDDTGDYAPLRSHKNAG